jgi:hypothetical protein
MGGETLPLFSHLSVSIHTGREEKKCGGVVVLGKM